jgi:type II secretory pathway component GspD/PulD (secretin)
MQKTSRPCGRRALAAACTLVTPLIIATAQPVRAQQASPAASGEPLVTLDVRGARLDQAVLALTAGNGLNNIVFRNPKNKEFSPVTVRLTDQPLRVVLKQLADSAGAVLKEEDGIYVLTAPDEGEKPAPPAPVVAPPAPKPAVRGQLVKLHLTYILPSEFKKMIEDPFYKEVFEMPKDMDPRYSPPPLPIIHEGATTPQQPVNALQSSQPTTPVPVSGAAGAAAGRDGESLDSAGARGQGIPGGGRGGFGGGAGQGFGGAQGGAGGFGQGGAGGAGAGQQSLRPPGVTQIISNDADNALLVEYDDVEDLNRLRELIRLLDVAPKQVLIKAEFVAVNLQDADSFGIDWRFSPAANLDVQIPPTSGTTPTITMAYASGNAVANLRAAVTRNRQNILQAPLISTTNNRPAFITVSTTVTINQSVTTATNAGIVTGTQQVPVTANNGLFVTPHINGDNSINMVLTPVLQSVQTTAAGGFVLTNQQLQTARRVQNGETMVLGGFINKNQTYTVTRVPILSDLPIIGNLFKQYDRSTQGGEVLVFVTPTIIEDRAQGGLGVSGASAAPTP